MSSCSHRPLTEALSPTLLPASFTLLFDLCARHRVTKNRRGARHDRTAYLCRRQISSGGCQSATITFPTAKRSLRRWQEPRPGNQLRSSNSFALRRCHEQTKVAFNSAFDVSLVALAHLSGFTVGSSPGESHEKLRCTEKSARAANYAFTKRTPLPAPNLFGISVISAGFLLSEDFFIVHTMLRV